MSRSVFIVLAVIAYAQAGAQANSFEITSWSLGAGIVDSTGGVSAGSETVENPFDAQDWVQRGASSARTDYDFAWHASFGQFLVEASHVAFDGNGGTRSASVGSIHITPSVDLLLTATGSYDYDLPGSAMQVSHGIDVYDDNTQIAAWGAFDHTFLNGPTSDTFNWSNQTVLPAGHQIQILYGTYLDAFGSSGFLASGEGFIHFTLQPVPEPSTLLPLALGALMLRRRRLRR